MAYSPRGEHGIVPELTEEQKLKNQQPLGTELRKEATALYERLPEPVKEVTEGVGNVVGKGLFGYVDENNTFQKGLLHSEMNPLGLQPIDPLRGYSAVMQAGAKATNVDPFVFEFGADLLLGGVMSRVGRFKPTPSTFRGAAAAIENLPPETLFKIDLPSILNQTPGGSYAFMSTTQPLVGKSPIRQAFTNIPTGATITQTKKALGPTKHYRRLSKKYQYITPDQLAGDKELLRRMQGREKALTELYKQRDILELEKIELTNTYSHLKTKVARKEAGVYRLFKNNERKLKDIGKGITEIASENPFVKSPRIYGIQGIRTKVKEAIEAFNDPLNRWHHINRSADTGKSMLTELAQDPYIAVNLFEHMKKEGVYSSGILENLSLIKEAPHNEWHAAMKSAGYEPTHFVTKINDWAATEASIFQLMEEASDAVLKGVKYTEKAGPGLGGKIVPPDPTAVNELFSLITAYGKLQKEINKELFTKYGAKRFEDIPGVAQIISEYRWRGRKPSK